MARPKRLPPRYRNREKFKEEWKPIEEMDGVYLISSFGRIWRKKHYRRYPRRYQGGYWKVSPAMEMTPYIYKGSWTVDLHHPVTRKPTKLSVRKLVSRYFLGTDRTELIDKTRPWDCGITNIRPIGFTRPNQKVFTEVIKQIQEEYRQAVQEGKEWGVRARLSKKYGLTKQRIGNIVEEVQSSSG